MKLNYFNFKRFGEEILLTNDFGCYTFVSDGDFRKIVARNVELKSELGKELHNKKMIYDETNLEYSSYHKYDMRHMKSHVNIATSLNP